MRLCHALMTVGLSLPSMLAFSLDKSQSSSSQVKTEENFLPSSSVIVNPFDSKDQADLEDIGATSQMGVSAFQGLGFDKKIRAFLRNKIGNTSVSVKQTREGNVLTDIARLFSMGPQIVTVKHRFYFGHYPICDHEMVAHQGKANDIFILGSIPNISQEQVPLVADDWPILAQALDLARIHLGLDSTPKLIRSEQCVLVQNKQALPVWQLTVENANLPYRMSVGTQMVYGTIPQFFDATLEVPVQSWDVNVNGTLGNSTQTLTSSTNLENEFFKTNTGTVPRATKGTQGFVDYQAGDITLDETSTFVHANQHYAFFKSLGYTWTQAQPLILRIHDSEIAGENNALYRPAVSTTDGHPAISIGDPDGIVLQNLATDKDVVNHELGHHTIFRKLTNTTGESLIIHEALADFFAFAAAGDSCLGETICPANSQICYVPGSCLRTASNSLKYKSSDWVIMGAHQRGQAISGMLWDLRESMGADNLTKLVFATVDLLGANSGLVDLFIAMLFADKNLFDKQHCAAIYAGLIDRKFGLLIENNNGVNIKCDDEATWVNPNSTADDGLTQPTSGSEGETPTSKPTKSNSCGSVGAKDTGKNLALPYIFFSLCLFHILRRGRRFWHGRSFFS